MEDIKLITLQESCIILVAFAHFSLAEVNHIIWVCYGLTLQLY